MTLRRPERFPDQLALALASPGAAGWLMALILALSAYAALSGAIAIPQESRLQVGIAAGVFFGGVGLAAGALGVARSPLAWGGVGLIAAFAWWSIISAAWSVAPDESWLAANRAAGYAAVAALALMAAPALRQAPGLTLYGLLATAVGVALYALAGKVVPIEVGPLDLDHASQFARLREPLGYWNALGLLMVMATPACLWLATDRDRPDGLRLGTLVCLQLLFVTIALTYSRGAIVALIAAVAMLAAASGAGLRVLAAAGAAALAALPAIAYAFSNDALSSNGVPADQRMGEGAMLGLLIVLGAALLVVLGRVAIGMAGRFPWNEERSRGAWRLLAVLAGLLVLSGVVAMAASERGLTGTISGEWREFRQPQVAAGGEPERLVSSSSSNRWIWWSEAVGGFSDKPVAGWGAGSFPIVHNLYRDHETEVRSTHSVPLQFFAETGLIGAALGLGGLGLLGAAALAGVRRAEGRERWARLALATAAFAWAVHSLYDWDWEIPAVTMPALIAAAVAASPRGGLHAGMAPLLGRRRRADARPIPPGLIAAGAAILAIAFAASSGLPWLAERARLQGQEISAIATKESGLEEAASKAALAARLNPFDEAPLFAQADVELRRGRLQEAEDLLVEAARLQPENFFIWQRLIDLESGRGNAALLRVALEERLSTDPLHAKNIAGITPFAFFIGTAPPELSPTAIGTTPSEEEREQAAAEEPP